MIDDDNDDDVLQKRTSTQHSSGQKKSVVVLMSFFLICWLSSNSRPALLLLSIRKVMNVYRSLTMSFFLLRPSLLFCCTICLVTEDGRNRMSVIGCLCCFFLTWTMKFLVLLFGVKCETAGFEIQKYGQPLYFKF
jgi:hypothetical protein